ncbi:MAG: polyprenyl synthetase family protein [Candidatus Accumulibacter sp.]|nr:polyprenyl synthetase family protein [Accumulibacter sp.]
MSYETIFQPVRQDMLAVDALIQERLHSRAALMRRVAAHIIQSGGKRIRPALVLLVSGALGYSGSLHHTLAAVIELIHTATLLHDDVIDDSALRRGRETANTLFGNAASILAGDFFYSRAFEMMVEVGEMRVMRVISEAISLIAEGEVLQLMNCHNADIDEAHYMEVIRCKTAKFFEAAARIGAILGKAPPQIEQGMADYGIHLGIAFQLIDDALDYSGIESELGKHPGDDLAEGKPTLPLIYVLRHGTAAQKTCVRNAIESAGRADFQEVLLAVRASGALEYAKKVAEAEARQAINALDGVPVSPCRDSLLELPLFAVARNS